MSLYSNKMPVEKQDLEQIANRSINRLRFTEGHTTPEDKKLLRGLAKAIEGGNLESYRVSPLHILGTTIGLGAIIQGCSVPMSVFDPMYGPHIFVGPITGLRDFKGHYDGRQGTLLGIDYNVPVGTNVIAVADGPILAVQNRRRGGPTIWQEHGNGYVSLYTHLNEILVDTGRFVKRGQLIAKSGDRGEISYPMLHYGFGKLYSGEETSRGSGRRFTLWIDPDNLGEGGSRPKLYNMSPIPDKISQSERIYYRDIIERALGELKPEYKSTKMPPELKSYFDYFQDPDASHTPLWSPYMMAGMLTKYRVYFNDGAIERWNQGFNKMTDPKAQVPIIITHPIQNPILVETKDLNKR